MKQEIYSLWDFTAYLLKSLLLEKVWKEKKTAFHNVGCLKKKKKTVWNSTSICELFYLSLTKTSIFRQIAGSIPCSSALTSEELQIFMLQRVALLAVLMENFAPVQEPPRCWHCQDPSIPPTPSPARAPETTSELLSFQADYNYSLSKQTLQVMTTFNSVH